MVYNVMLAMIIPVITGMPAAAVLVPAAAIVSKFASDTVAGIIESVADKRNNFRLRRSDFNQVCTELFTCFTHIELAFPKKNILEMMSRPSQFVRLLAKKAPSMEIENIVISLDLMYMWYYQPCAQQVFMDRFKKMTAEERHIYVRFQGALHEYKEVSRLFISGMLGNNFTQALAFYLDNYEDYLSSLERLRKQTDARELGLASAPQAKTLTEKIRKFFRGIKDRFDPRKLKQANSATLYLEHSEKAVEPAKIEEVKVVEEKVASGEPKQVP